MTSEACAILAACLALWAVNGLSQPAVSAPGPRQPGAPALPAPPPSASAQTNAAAGDAPLLEVAHALIVTVELEFGPKLPTIAEALASIERRSRPDDGVGRTFAILDAYGEPMPPRKFHISMHISAEKPGTAALVFKPTGAVLWRCRIVKGTNQPSVNFLKGGLMVLLDSGTGHTVTVDGSRNPHSILDANVKEMGVPVRDIWPEGEEREVSFLYSACGCPVKVMAIRVGDRTVRTKDVPVIFPDDPAVATVIQKLMRWD